MVASNIGELIMLLKTFNPKYKWYGFDDGSLVIVTSNDQEVFIDSEAAEDGPDEGDGYDGDWE